jgi:hypothetical protein
MVVLVGSSKFALRGPADQLEGGDAVDPALDVSTAFVNSEQYQYKTLGLKT